MRHLATGGMGEVWLAEAPGAAGFAKRLVIKTLRPELAADARLVEQLVAEGRLLEALDHPNIAQILDLGVEDGTWFLAIEMVVGHDLRALMRARGAALDPAPTLAILAAAAAALDHAATRPGPDGKPLGIVHYDVTPSNLMVRRDGLVKLVDFGVARTAMMARLQPGSLRGKLPYMGPEHLEVRRADVRADLFSLGLCAYELLTGERALEVADADGLQVAWSTLPARLARLEAAQVPGSLALLIRSMVALDPASRPASAADVAAAVARISLELGVAAPERRLADALGPAFDRLEAEAQGIDATLAGLLSPAPRTDATGTVSLPGLSLGSLQDAPSAASDAPVLQAPPAPVDASPVRPPETITTDGGRARRQIELRRRTYFGAAAALLVAGLLGWWLGTRDGAPATSPVAAGTDAGGASVSADAGAAVDSDGAGGFDPAAVATPTTVAVAAVADAGPTPEDGAKGMAAAEAGDTGTASVASPDAAHSGEETAAETGPARPASDASEGPPPAAPARAIRRPVAAIQRAEVRFRVVPADAEVFVDDRRVAGGPGSSGVHALKLAPGKRVIRVRERLSGKSEERKLDLQPGEQRRIPGFVLVRGLP
ncbi:MAG: serine/threonine protein kinase [Deltaproteobacteria bacterium]|nr:serine/threonine protein kinase [Deltaproteobacteria bacterium]